MELHQLHNLAAEGIFTPQLPQGLLRQAGAFLGVAVEMGHSLLVHGAAGGLPAVVEEGGQAQCLLPRHRNHRLDGMPLEVQVMVGVPLLIPRHLPQTGQAGEDAQNIPEGPKHRLQPLRRGAEEPPQLGAAPLRGHRF